MSIKKSIIIFLIACLSVLVTSCNRIQEKTITEKNYKITQYGDYNGSAHMFYSIEDDEGNLIIIDGGLDYETDIVKNVIEQHNNHVNAWILTHPHHDHVGVFNTIMSGSDEIVVDDIYVVDVDYDRYKETAQWYDVYEVCETYRFIIEELDNVHILNEGDSFNCIGLKFDVIHAWDQDVNNLPDHLCNNGSMSFIVSGNRDKMLFLADTQSEVEQYILDRHKDEISNVDYIQLGHHGNWGCSIDFYDNTNPKAVFFDGTQDLFEDDKFDAGILKEYFEKRNVEIYTFLTQPNTIDFK